MKRIGIYSGTFDPIHEGHVAFAKQAIAECGLDKIFFLVEPRPRRKQGVKALEHRVAMVQMAIKHQSKLGTIILNQARFSVLETLPVLLKRFKGQQLYMLLGGDHVINHLAEWPHVEELVNSVCFVVGVRGSGQKTVIETLSALQKTRGLKLDYEMFESAFPEYSSSAIRLAVKRGKEPVGLLPVVREYVQKENLYSSIS